MSAGAQYTKPIGKDWTATLRGDVYYQSNSFARVFNDTPYDQLHGYSNVNLSLTFADADGLEVMAYAKNLFDTTAITGAYLNSDDTAPHHQRLRHRSEALRASDHQDAVTLMIPFPLSPTWSDVVTGGLSLRTKEETS